MFGKKSRRLKWAAILPGLFLLLTGCAPIKSGVLNPQGPVAKKEYDLILWTSGLMLIIFIAVAVLFIYMLVKYRAKPENEGYEPPEVHENKWLEMIWTAIPIIIVALIAVPTCIMTFDLEKSPSPHKKPLVVEVTSADWKWIFKYPEQGIETVNYVKIPADVPVRFELNAVGAMNSFWVPELGGQEYTMPGMDMKLWLEADKPGTYVGRSANFSGRGFTHMQFDVIAQKETDFNAWVDHVKKTAPKQTEADWQKLIKPGLVGELTYSSYTKLKEDPNMNMNHDMKGMDHGTADMSSMHHDMGGMSHDMKSMTHGAETITNMEQN
ncbi:MAG: cytochrome aa3 quinol oxidase subunit II [Thermoactinomyces sp.]|jgi:cytochrome aa3-600 menaquinol oxidase subunit II